jgi:hypothetical protein
MIGFVDTIANPRRNQMPDTSTMQDHIDDLMQERQELLKELNLLRSIAEEMYHAMSGIDYTAIIRARTRYEQANV